MGKTVVGDEVAGVLSPAVIGEGKFVYVSGQGPLVDGAYEPGPFAEEARLTLANLGERLAEAGAGFGDVVRVGVFLADIADIAELNTVYAEVFESPRPARTTIQAGALPGGIKVEIDCVAVLPD